MNLATVYPAIRQKVNDYLLNNKGQDLKQYIAELGQVEKIKAQLSGKKFTNQECMEGFALSLFSSQTNWIIIQKNIDLIRNTLFSIKLRDFSNYSTQEIMDLSHFFKENGFNKIKLSDDLYNLKLFCTYLKNQYYKEDDFDLFDKYSIVWRDKSPHNVRELLTNVDDFRGMGIALSAEFIRNIGFDVAKPDVHIMRLFSTDKLGFGTWVEKKQSSDYNREQLFSAITLIANAAKELNVFQAEIDNVLWLYCAKSYCNICSAKPKCYECPLVLKNICNCNNRKIKDQSTTTYPIGKSHPEAVMNQTNTYIILASITSAGNEPGKSAIYKRLTILTDFRKHIVPNQIYTIRYQEDSATGEFSSEYYEIDHDKFLEWSGGQYCKVKLDISEINKRVLTITELHPRNK